VTAFAVSLGIDCDRQLIFDAASRRLVAIAEGCNSPVPVCLQGDPTFQPPIDCWTNGVQATNACADAGLADATPDGAGSACTSDAQCPTGYVCGYFTNDDCPSTGQCVFGDFDHDPTCSPTTLCACDGTTTRACMGSLGGFALKPVPTYYPTAGCPDGI
jgi:hypothetical protein